MGDGLDEFFDDVIILSRHVIVENDAGSRLGKQIDGEEAEYAESSVYKHQIGFLSASEYGGGVAANVVAFFVGDGAAPVTHAA